MLREFFAATGRDAGRGEKLIAWLGLVVVVLNALFQAYIKSAVNSWYTGFYDLLQHSGETVLFKNSTSEAVEEASRKAQQEVWDQLMLFGRIVLPSVIISPSARWLRSQWAMHWRMCLMRSYMHDWDPNVPPIEGASQRLHEDTQRFAKGVDSYLSVLLNSVCTLVVFTPILFRLGGKVAPPPLIGLPSLGDGWMFFCACASAAVGLGVAMLAGRHLVDLEVANQRVEAELRRDLVVLETTPELICGVRQNKTADLPEAPQLLAPPAPFFTRLWRALVDNYSALFRNFLGLNLWLDCSDQFISPPSPSISLHLQSALP